MNILNALKPIQGFLDLVRSIHSSNAGGLNEPSDANRDEPGEARSCPFGRPVRHARRARTEDAEKNKRRGDAVCVHAHDATP